MDSSLVTLGLPLALAVIMFGLGLDLTPADFARVARQPRAAAIALACQLLLLPAACFALVVLFRLPPILAVMGLQLGYLMGGSILVETVFSWPGMGLLLNSAIFQRDLPVLQGTILVLAMFFVALNLFVDLVQTALDPRIKRA